MLTVSQEQVAVWIRNFNPFIPGGARWPTRGGIYEPLLIYNTLRGQYVPWLATHYEWQQNNTRLAFDLRQGVRWSDGAHLSAEDVVFSFELLRKHAGLDVNGLWRFVDRVESQQEGSRIVFTFKRPFVVGLSQIASQVIVPRHVWEPIERPLHFSNPDPVGSGPFTEVLSFNHQIFKLGRNPRYWQPGKPKVRALRFPAIPANEQAILGLLKGDIDWAGNFVPAIERIFVPRDPEHHRYWFPLVGSSVFLYPNHRREPFGDRRIRRAISIAIDRARMVKIAAYNYSKPSDPTGLSDGYSSWRDKRASKESTWVTFDATRANRLLDKAGLLRGADGVRRSSDGKPLTFELIVVSGWSDWQRAAQLVARDLREVGIEVTVRPFEYSAWWQRLQDGSFDLAIGWTIEGATPYDCYRWLMSPTTVKPVGEPAAGNWHRYGNKKALDLFNRFERTADQEEQQLLGAQMQRLFVEELPAIPLYPNPSWGVYNTKRFKGFPSAENPYALLSPNIDMQFLFTLLSLEPVVP